ncbi:MAG: CapA family protein [Proteobacteria bacterium]|nr:CapA family protein [Pseudomonadota bacterium]
MRQIFVLPFYRYELPRDGFHRYGKVMLVLLLSLLWHTGINAQTPPPPLHPRDMAMTIPGDFTLASVGDLMIRRPASQTADASVQAVLQLIRDADLAVGNMEGELANYRDFDGPLNGFVGTHEVAADLKAMGFDMVNRAQNHLLDAEVAGMFSTNALLDEAGIAHAGTGKNLDEAAAPVFLELPGGRVAMVGMHAPLWAEMRRLSATPQVGNLGGRPGLNMLNYSETIVVTDEQLASLRAVRDQLREYRSNYDNPRPIPANEPSDSVQFPASSSGRDDPTYRAARPGETPGTVDYAINPNDLTRTLRSIRNAKQYADFVVATAHIHQGQSVLEQMHRSTRPPAFYVDLAHQAIDVGADAFVGHGVQLLRGIEIYKGKPIFYGLGEFFREAQWTLPVALGNVDADQNSGLQNFARNFGNSTESLESLVAISHYKDGELAEVRLYPTELGANGPDSRLGIPRLAPPEIAQRILERMQRLSREFGTTIDIQGNVGVIRVGQ